VAYVIFQYLLSCTFMIACPNVPLSQCHNGAYGGLSIGCVGHEDSLPVGSS
jgi:hypothetical protein